MQRFVVSSDGTRIAVYEQGDRQRPTLVMVHGWPDSHVLWNGVTGELGDRFHIVRYDNRGAGDSDVPKPVAAYRMDRFADDLSAVIDAVSPGRPVHVLAHDWGSVGAWEYLSRPEASARVASFTSVSGPSTDHYGTFVRSRLARPYRPIRFAKAVNLASRFSYWIPFSIPVIAPALMRCGAARRLQAIDTPGPKFQSETLDTDAANSLKIYRANSIRSFTTLRSDHYVTVPVQLICNDHDPVVRGHGYDDESRWVPMLWRRDLKAGHWAPFSHWRAIAGATAELIDHIEGAPAARRCGAHKSAGHANPSATHWFRLPVQAAVSAVPLPSHSPRLAPNWWSATSTKHPRSPPPTRSPPAVASHMPTASTCPMPRRWRVSSSRSAARTGHPTSW